MKRGKGEHVTQRQRGGEKGDEKHEGRVEWEQMRGTERERRKWESDREAVEQIKVKLSAFTYLDERF